MSCEYMYYIGYQHEGKVYPLGVYDAFGQLSAVLCRSRSFASKLYERFYDVKEDSASDELKAVNYFWRPDWRDSSKHHLNVRMCPLDELPLGSFIKTGYFLIEDVETFERTGDADDLFYDRISPTVYAAMAANERSFGRNREPELDCEDNPLPLHYASDYMFYAYPDYSCEEYESFIIRKAADMVSEFNSKLPDGAKIVILETEG